MIKVNKLNSNCTHPLLLLPFEVAEPPDSRLSFCRWNFSNNSPPAELLFIEIAAALEMNGIKANALEINNKIQCFIQNQFETNLFFITILLPAFSIPCAIGPPATDAAATDLIGKCIGGLITAGGWCIWANGGGA